MKKSVIRNNFNTRGNDDITSALGKELDDKAVSYGIVRTLLWVGFLMTYKNEENVHNELEKFIEQCEKQYPEFKYLTRY